MQNKDNFSFEPSSVNGKNGANISEKLLEQLVTALKPKPFYKRHPILCFLGVALLVCMIVSAFLPDEAGYFAGDRIAVVRVEGPIMDSNDTLEWISELNKDDSVKGVLLRIDSPGGDAAASQEIYSALLKLGMKKPIVASMGSYAASGGLMVAMAAQHIVANPSTATGSIGVRYDIPQLYEVMNKIGIGKVTLTTGPYKDAADPTKPLSEQDRAYLEGVIDDIYEQFVLLIAEGRKMPVDKVRPLADGRVFTGRAAKDLGLVDELGGQDAALSVLYQLTGVSDRAELYEHVKWEDFFAGASASVLGINLSWKASSPSFLLLY